MMYPKVAFLSAVGALKGPDWHNQNDDTKKCDFYVRAFVKFISYK